MAKVFILSQKHLIPERFLQDLRLGLRSGQLAAFPTDTVYGLGTSAESEAGIEAIYRLKGRAPLKPLPWLVDSASSAWRWVQPTPQALALAKKFWPGPLTMVLPPTPEGARLCRGQASIGIRVPDHQALQTILKELGAPLASTSANLSGSPSTGRAEDLGAIEAGVDFMILEDAPLSGAESSVVDLTGETPKMLRRGAVGEEDVLRAAQGAAAGRA